MNNDFRLRYIMEVNNIAKIRAKKRLILSMINAIGTTPDSTLLRETSWRLLRLDARLSDDLRRYLIRAHRISLLSSVVRTPNNGNNNNGNNGNNNNGGNGDNNGNGNNNSNGNNTNNNNNNRNIITSLLLLLFGVLVTSLFVLLVFYWVNHITGLLASLEVGYIF